MTVFNRWIYFLHQWEQVEADFIAGIFVFQIGTVCYAYLDAPAPEAFLFETLHPLGFNSAQIKDIANSLHGQSGKQFVSKEWRVIKDRNLLLLETIRPEDESTLPYQLIKEEREFTPDFRIPREKETACFDADKLNEEIHCRKWQAGRYIHPLWHDGQEKNKRLSDRPQILHQPKRTPMGSLLR